MTRSVCLILVLALLSGCAAKQSLIEEDPSGFRIYAGYSSAMLYRLHELVELRSPEPGQDKPLDARALATGLRQTVWEYNVESANMCWKGLTTRVSCLPALDPPWLTESQNSSPTNKELERRVDWVMARVQRLWDAACEDFKMSNPSPQDYMGYCSIE